MSRLSVLLLLLPAAALSAHDPLNIEIGALDRLLAEQPGAVDLYVARGDLLRLAGRHQEARRDFALAHRLDPARVDIELHRALLDADSGRLEAAVAALTRYLELASELEEPSGMVASAHLARARCLLQLKRDEEAIDDFSQAIATHPSAGPELYLERAQATLAAAARREGGAAAARALEGLEEGISRLGPVVSLEEAAIELDLRLGEVERALARLDAAYAAAPRRDVWHQRRAELLAQAGRRDEARREIEAAMRALDSLPPGRRSAAAVQEQRKRLSDRLEESRLP